MPGGCVAALVGSDVVYLAGRGTTAATMTPYDVCALHVVDGAILAGDPPHDADAYLGALRSGPRAVGLTSEGMAGAGDVVALVASLCHTSWEEAEGDARAAGALVGAYPAEVR